MSCNYRQLKIIAVKYNKTVKRSRPDWNVRTNFVSSNKPRKLTRAMDPPQPRHLSLYLQAKTLKNRQESAYRFCRLIKTKTMTSYSTYFKKFKKFWANLDENKREPDELGFYYIDEEGEQRPQHQRKWREYGVLISRQTLEKYMTEIESVVSLL